jgi:hypothetical protein
MFGGTPCALVLSLALAACSTPTPNSTMMEESSDPNALRPVGAFAGIGNRSDRSAAYFLEAGRVLQHPRCLNCHPVERIPTQGDDLHPHVPMMQAGNEGHGLPALHCNTCHQASNVNTYSESFATMPGHSHWALAPASMAWQGKSLREICLQLKDPARNGGRTLAKIHEHMAEDSLVGWAWHPGVNRTPAPGTQSALGELLAAWIETGAECPATDAHN